MRLQEVDLLIHKWDSTVRALEIAEAAYEKTDCIVRPTHSLGSCWSCRGERVDSIDHYAGEQAGPGIWQEPACSAASAVLRSACWARTFGLRPAGLVRQLEREVLEARQKALEVALPMQHRLAAHIRLLSRTARQAPSCRWPWTWRHSIEQGMRPTTTALRSCVAVPSPPELTGQRGWCCAQAEPLGSFFVFFSSQVRQQRRPKLRIANPSNLISIFSMLLYYK